MINAGSFDSMLLPNCFEAMKEHWGWGYPVARTVKESGRLG